MGLSYEWVENSIVSISKLKWHSKSAVPEHITWSVFVVGTNNFDLKLPEIAHPHTLLKHHPSANGPIFYCRPLRQGSTKGVALEAWVLQNVPKLFQKTFWGSFFWFSRSLFVSLLVWLRNEANPQHVALEIKAHDLCGITSTLHIQYFFLDMILSSSLNIFPETQSLWESPHFISGRMTI